MTQEATAIPRAHAGEMRVRPLRSACRGQGMVEYIIIVALIAVAALAVYSATGKTVRNQTAGMAKELAGKDADQAIITEAANAASGRANDPQKRGMGRYNYANDHD